MQNRKNAEIEDFLVDELDSFFGKKIDDYVVTESTDTPRTILTIEFVLYNHSLIRLTLENDTVFFSIVGSGVLLRVLKKSPALDGFSLTMKALDDEVRLRIPDKFLSAKGWS